MKTTVTAIDFGTSKIVALMAESSGRQRCDIIGAGIAPYDGYVDRQWNNPQLLNEAIGNAIHEAEMQSHSRIREVNVGVPGEFSSVKTVEVKVELQGADPKVTERDIHALLEKASQEIGEIQGSIIHRSPAWFIIDDGKKTMEPVGIHGYELRAMICFVIADQFFLEDVKERFRALNIMVRGCYSTPIGQSMLFIPDEDRDRTAILVDMGYLSTEVMAVEGEAITYLHSIPMGGGHIAADMAYGLEVTLNEAEKIKRGYVYGLSSGSATFEGVDKEGNTKTFTQEDVEKVLEPRAEEICEAIRDAIQNSGVKLGNWSNVYLTGGGLAINRGGRELLSAKLNKPVRELPRKAVRLSSPAYSSALGLLDMIIENAPNAPQGGVGSFFRSLFGG